MIVAFAGRIASGKSVISRAIAAHYSVDWVSFGDAVRREAKRRGRAASRSALQDLGEELIAAGWDALWPLVTDQVAWNGHSSLIVDGVRHLSAIESLQRLAEPSPLYVVFVHTPLDRRLEWLTERGVSGPEAAAADRHTNEAQLDAVRGKADLVVTNDAGLDGVVAQVINALEEAGGLA